MEAVFRGLEKKAQVIGTGGAFDVKFVFCFSTVLFLSSGEKAILKNANEYLHKSACFTDFTANQCLQCTVSGFVFFFVDLHLVF